MSYNTDGWFMVGMICILMVFGLFVAYGVISELFLPIADAQARALGL
jgi:hypothetical protein